jgi:regulatory protein YycH of two-component signal transduction system YycFG
MDMMFLLQLHRDLPPVERFTEVLDSLRSLEIPEDVVETITFQFTFAKDLPSTCYGQSTQWIEEVLETIGIEVKWI